MKFSESNASQIYDIIASQIYDIIASQIYFWIKDTSGCENVISKFKGFIKLYFIVLVFNLYLFHM